MSVKGVGHMMGNDHCVMLLKYTRKTVGEQLLPVTCILLSLHFHVHLFESC